MFNFEREQWNLRHRMARCIGAISSSCAQISAAPVIRSVSHGIFTEPPHDIAVKTRKFADETLSAIVDHDAPSSGFVSAHADCVRQ